MLEEYNSRDGLWWDNKGGFFGLNYMEADDSLDGFLSDNKGLNSRTAEEVSGVIRLANLTKESHVMDCPCGYGRHSLGLAAQGLEVTGVDINAEFIAICGYQKLARNLANVNFLRTSMLNLKFKEKFDAVINMFYSFGFFSDEENIKVARNFFEALKPSGRFLMHTHVTVPRFEKKLIKQHEVRKLNSGKSLELTRFLDSETRREIGKWTLIDNSGAKQELAPYSVRIYSAPEFESLCKSVGFARVEFFCDWQGSPYKEDSDLLIAVATK